MRVRETRRNVAHKTAHAFAGLQGYIAHKTVADNYVGLARKDVAPFHVANESDGQRFEQGKGLAGEVVALGLLLADGEQAYARLVDFEHGAGVHLAHEGKLGQIVGLAVDVGAHIEQHTRVPCGTGHGIGQGGAIDAGQRAQNHFCCSHGRAGIARGDKPRGLALAHQLEADAQRAVALGADGVGGLFLHGDALGGVLNDDRQVLVFEVLVKLGAQLLLRTDEMDPHRQGAAGEDRPANLRLGSLVGTKCVQRDVNQHGEASLLGLFLDVEHGAALISAALGAGVVGQLLLVTAGALGEAGGRQEVVGAAQRSAAR